jgi:hypothetical protein
MLSTLRSSADGPHHTRTSAAARRRARSLASPRESPPTSTRTTRTTARFVAAAAASVFTAAAVVVVPVGVTGRSGLGAHGHGNPSWSVNAQQHPPVSQHVGVATASARSVGVAHGITAACSTNTSMSQNERLMS